MRTIAASLVLLCYHRHLFALSRRNAGAPLHGKDSPNPDSRIASPNPLVAGPCRDAGSVSPSPRLTGAEGSNGERVGVRCSSHHLGVHGEGAGFMGSRPDTAFFFGSNHVTPAAPVLKSAPGAGVMPLLGCASACCINKRRYNIRLAFPAALATLGFMLSEPLLTSRSARWRLTACAISLPLCSIRPAVKPWRQKHRQPQTHPWPGQTMNASNPQPPPELHLLAVSPFVHFWHFQNRVTKRDKRCQKVPESVIRSSLVISGNLWSSPGAPMPSGGPECAAKRTGWHRWPFPLAGVRPAHIRKWATKCDKIGIGSSLPAVLKETQQIGAL